MYFCIRCNVIFPIFPLKFSGHLKILHRIGTSALTFSLLLTGLFIFTAWKAVDESLIFSDDPLKDQQVWQSNSTIPVGYDDMEAEAYLQLKKINSSNDIDGLRFLEDDQPVPGLEFFARSLSPSAIALLQYSGINPYILDMRTTLKRQAQLDFQKTNENALVFGDEQSKEVVGIREEKVVRELHQGDVAPPDWISAPYTDRSSGSLKVDMTNGVINHTQQIKRDYPFEQKNAYGFDTIPPPKQTDILIIDLGQADKADPGDRIRYEVTIENDGSNDGEGIQLHIVPDPLTTFVPGSFRSSPLAVNDSYTSTGNVGISVSAANGLKANDFDDDISGATITSGTFSTTGGGSIMINADGSFMYTPAVGFTGSDTYIYTLNDGNGIGGGVPAVDMATVTITVSNLIWFIDNSSIAGTQDGRLNTPFKTIANFNASALPTVGQVIFIKNTGTEYRGGFILKNNQLLFGSGHSGGSNLASAGVLPFMVATHSFTLPAINGARPLIRNMGTGGSGNGIGIVLASGNTIRGVEIGRCELVKISGSTFGTLTIGNTTNPDVALSGNQNVLDLRNGVFAASSKVTSINSPDSSGLLLNVVSGLLASGSTLIGAMGSGSFGIDIDSSSASLDFGTTNVSSFNFGPAVSITSSGTGTFTFGSLVITSNGGGAGLLASTGGTINIGGTGSTITGRPALDITNTSFGSGATFATITSAMSSGKGVNLDNVSGPVVINGGSISNSTGIGFDVNAGSSTITYAGTISNANRAVEVTGRTGGTVTFSGNITNTGTGINVASNTGGTIAFSGSSKSLTTGGNAAVTLATNTGATINFTGGGLAITTTTGTGFNATGGATAVTVQGTGNTINSGTGPALNVVNTTIGTSNLNFQSISANGATNGIVLNATDSSGGLTVTGDGGGSNNGSGGTIQNTTGAGISINSSRNSSFGYMNITNSGTDGIRITDINGFTLNRCNISDGSGTAPADKSIDIGDFSTGTAVNGSINLTNNVLGPPTGNAPHDLLAIGVSSGTSVWNITGTTFRNTGNSGINCELRGTAVFTSLTVAGCSFAGAGGLISARGVFVNNLDDSVLGLATIQTSTFTNNNIHIDMNQQNDTDPVGSHTFNIMNNTLTGARSHGMNIFAAAGTFGGTFTGTVNGNTIGNAGVANSGSEIGNGIRVNVNGGSDVTMLLNNNTIRQTPNGRGIEVISRNGTGGLDITVTNNNVNPQASIAPLAAILLQSNCLTTCNTLRADIRGNTVPVGMDVTDLVNTYLQIIESSTSTFELVDTTSPISGTCATELAATNTGSTGVLGGCSLIAGPISVP